MLLKKKLSLVLIAASLLLVAGTILPGTVLAAGEEPTLKSVRLWVNPEYDDPRVLTMVEGQVVGVTGPTVVKFMVPMNAEMYSAGYRDAAGNYQRAPDWDGVSNISPSDIDGWNVVSFTINTEKFRVEWYYDSIQGLPDKTISYDYLTLYPISDMSVLIQKPAKATDFQVSPKEQSTFNDSEGLQVFRYSVANVEKDATIHYDISYTKADSVPSFSPSSQGTGNGGSSSALWLAVGFGGILAVALVLILNQNASKRRMAASARSRRAQGTAPRRAAGGAAGARRFCTECGTGLQGQAKFCPECGKRM